MFHDCIEVRQSKYVEGIFTQQALHSTELRTLLGTNCKSYLQPNIPI